MDLDRVKLETVRAAVDGFKSIILRNTDDSCQTIDLACGCRVTLGPGAEATLFPRADGRLVCELHAGEAGA